MAWRRKRKKKAIEAKITTKEVQGEDGKSYTLALVPTEQAREFQEQVTPKGSKWQDVAGRMWAKVRPHYPEPTSDGQGGGVTDPVNQGALVGSSPMADRYYEMMKLEQNRNAKYNDYKKIDTECTIARRALTVTVGNAYISKDGDQVSYEVKSEDSQIQNVCEELDQRLEMKQYAPKFCRSALRYGDGFTQLETDGAGIIVGKRYHRPKEVRRNEDIAGRLRAEAAYELIDPETGDSVAGLYPWQMVHIRYEHDLDNIYGTSFFLPARKPWRRLEAIADSMVVKRLTRAVKRYAYTVPMHKATPAQEQDRILKRMERSMRRNSIVDSSGNIEYRRRIAVEEQDIFMPWLEQEKKPEVAMFDPGGLQDALQDVIYFREDLIVGLGVPPAYLGLDKEVRGRAHLGWIDIEYARMIRGIQLFMAGFHRRVYNTQFWLLGQDVEEDAYQVLYPPVSFVDERMRAEVDQIKWTVCQIANKQLGVPLDWALMNIVGLDEENTGEIMAGLSDPEPEPQGMFPMASRKEMAAIRDMVRGNEKLQDDLLDLRSRLMTVAKEGYLRPAEF